VFFQGGEVVSEHAEFLVQHLFRVLRGLQLDFEGVDGVAFLGFDIEQDVYFRLHFALLSFELFGQHFQFFVAELLAGEFFGESGVVIPVVDEFDL
jgi:hypothetical protein